MYYECRKGVTKCKVAVVHEPNEQRANSATPGICSAFCFGCLWCRHAEFLPHEDCPASDILYSFSRTHVCTCIQSIACYSAAEVHLTLVQAEGLTKLVEHNNKKVAEKQLEGLKTELTEMITQDPPTPVDECLAAIKAKKAEFSLADSELVKVSSYTKILFVRTAWLPHTSCWLCIVQPFLTMLLKSSECNRLLLCKLPQCLLIWMHPGFVLEKKPEVARFELC